MSEKEIINNFKRGEIANTIALHEFDRENVSLKELSNYIEEVFLSYNVHPNKAGLTGPNGSSGRSVILYKNGKKKLEKVNYEGMDLISFYANPSFDYDDNFESIFYFSINLHKPKCTLVLTLCDNITGFKREDYSKITARLLELTGAKYGYIYQRPFKLGPSWYPSGVIEGLERNDPEAELISEWARKYNRPDGKYVTGDLRDIYEGNIIRNEHLIRDVGGQSLKDWIEKDGANGKIEDLGYGRYIWWVDADKIEHVRNGLKDTGIILCI